MSLMFISLSLINLYIYITYKLIVSHINININTQYVEKLNETAHYKFLMAVLKFYYLNPFWFCINMFISCDILGFILFCPLNPPNIILSREFIFGLL